MVIAGRHVPQPVMIAGVFLGLYVLAGSEPSIAVGVAGVLALGMLVKVSTKK